MASNPIESNNLELFSPLVLHPETTADRIEQKRLTRADKMNVLIPFEPGTAAKRLAERAAEQAFVRLSEGRIIGGGSGGKSYSFILRTDSKSHLWKRISRLGRTVPGRVCWHGHKEFLTKLFEDTPHAHVKTMLANYGGLTEFTTKYPSTYVKPGWNVEAAANVRCICKEVESAFGPAGEEEPLEYGILDGELWVECRKCVKPYEDTYFHRATYNGVCTSDAAFQSQPRHVMQKIFTID